MSGMALAFYRKYRPAVFADLIGQEGVAKILREAARRGRIAHGYLLSGPRGTGKTTTARLIAKIANCLARENLLETGEPCNRCAACNSINEGSALDIIEIDAASNRGIDEMRDLKESARVSPALLRRRVFIIDEAHMLTKEAANALLKILEEPPEHVIIVLATTEMEKIPATIASRAQRFYFRRAPISEIVGKLARVAKEERIEAPVEALELIAAVAEGSFRDAESLLDQMSAMGERRVSVEAVEETVGRTGFRKVAEVAEALLMGDQDKALLEITEIADGGHDLVQFTKDLIIHLRRAAVLKFSPPMRVALGRELTPAHLEITLAHAEKFSERHLDLIKALIQAYGQMRYSQFPIIPLELTVIEGCKK